MKKIIEIVFIIINVIVKVIISKISLKGNVFRQIAFDQNFIIKNPLSGKQALAFVLPEIENTIYRNLSDGCVLSPVLPVPV